MSIQTNQSLFVPILVYLVLPLCSGVAALLLRRHVRRLLPTKAKPLPGTEEEALRKRLHDLIAILPSHPSILSTAVSHPISLQVEARLLAGCPSQALEEAEQEVLENPGDPGVFLALAKALLYSNREDDARAALRWAQRLGASDPEMDYLWARLSPMDLSALRRCLAACFADPCYAEALYLLGRLCLRLGFEGEGRHLLRRIAPLMALSLERLAYRRDLRRLEEDGGTHLPELDRESKKGLSRIQSSRAAQQV